MICYVALFTLSISAKRMMGTTLQILSNDSCGMNARSGNVSESFRLACKTSNIQYDPINTVAKCRHVFCNVHVSRKGSGDNLAMVYQ